MTYYPHKHVLIAHQVRATSDHGTMERWNVVVPAGIVKLAVPSGVASSTAKEFADEIETDIYVERGDDEAPVPYWMAGEEAPLFDLESWAKDSK